VSKPTIFNSKSAITSLAAVTAGAICTATNPVFVRFSELEPLASAFHRMLWALPILLLWQYFDKTPRISAATKSSDWWLLVLCGIFFAADLIALHLAIDLTLAANAIVFLNAQPLYVVIFGWLFFSERVSAGFLVAMILAFSGIAVLMWSGAHVGNGNLMGDSLGIAAGVFYAGFLLTAKRLRSRHSSITINIWTCVAALPVLLLVALINTASIIPDTLEDWGYMLSLGIVSHALGQGLIVWGLARLHSGMSAIALLIAPIATACFAWVLLGEQLNSTQILAMFVVLVAIQTAWRYSKQENNAVGKSNVKNGDRAK
jgi:drug/metabolite transporter (DMT)-like permease